MIFICQACGFVFERVSRPDICPYCDNKRLEYADAREKIAFLKRKEEGLQASGGAEMQTRQNSGAARE
jgi:DNA-directed RNA polymerase subunit RPC12/RpoP